MQGKLNEFECNKVWDFLERLLERTIIGTRWVFCNALNKDGEAVRNKQG